MHDGMAVVYLTACANVSPSGLFCAGAESFRVPRQTDEEVGTLTKITGTLRSYYDSAVNTASEYVDQIKGLKVEEKAK